MDTLRVNIFNTSSNLPLLAAMQAGEFAAQGLNIEVQHTPNSDEQRAGLPAGLFEIAHAAVDNAVALIESGADAVIVCGGDAGLNDFIVRPEIGGFEDLRGKLLAVDAPNTAYALAAKKSSRTAACWKAATTRSSLRAAPARAPPPWPATRSWPAA